MSSCNYSGRFDDEPSWRTKDSAPSIEPAPPSGIPLAQDGEEAYLRRLAMSTRPGAPAFSPPAITAPENSQPVSSAAPELAMTGEEAYLRRLAMSSGDPMPPRVASPGPAIPAALPIQDEMADEEPYLSVTPPPAPTLAPPPAAELSAEVRAKRDAAAAIAARFSQMAQQQPSAPTPVTPPPASDKSTEVPPAESYVVTFDLFQHLLFSTRLLGVVLTISPHG